MRAQPCPSHGRTRAPLRASGLFRPVLFHEAKPQRHLTPGRWAVPAAAGVGGIKPEMRGWGTQLEAQACAWPTRTKGQGKNSGKKKHLITGGKEEERCTAGRVGGRVCCLLRKARWAKGRSPEKLYLLAEDGERAMDRTGRGPRLQAHMRKAQQNCKKQVRGVHPAVRPAGPQRAGGRAGVSIHHLQNSQGAGWHGHPPSHTTDPTKAGDTHLQRTGLGMAWAHPPTFQRFPHSLQTTNVVIGSSELRVCTCGEGHGGRGPAPGPQSLAAGSPREQDFPGVTTWGARHPWPRAALASRRLG